MSASGLSILPFSPKSIYLLPGVTEQVLIKMDNMLDKIEGQLIDHGAPPIRKPERCDVLPIFWVAVMELTLSSYNPGTVLFTIYPHYGNLN